MIEVMAQYGYLGLFFSVLVDQLGLPLPSMLMVMAAGALVGLGELNLAITLILVVTASLIANFVWFEIGRRRGISVLGVLCRYSLESDTCVRETEKKFIRHGAKTLLYAKFFPGLSEISPPLAGIIKMKVSTFLLYDLAGCLIWSGTFLGIGYLFSDQLEQIAQHIERFGSWVFIVLVLGLLTYMLVKYYIRRRFLKRIVTARITSLELKEMIDKGGLPMIVDLRHEIDFNMDPRMLPGTVRLSVDEIEKRHEELPRDREIILYCTCPNEAASASVAIKLHRRGIRNVRPLAGGFTAWTALDFPLESE